MKCLYKNKHIIKGTLTFQLLLIFGLIFEKCFVHTGNHEEKRVRVEPYYIFVKYDSSTEGTQTAFHQTVDILNLNNTNPVECNGTGWFCLRWSEYAKFQIEKTDNNCEKYEYISTLSNPLRVRFDITNLFLFGGAEQKDQTWPADFQNNAYHPFVSFMESYLGVLEPFWLVSNGMYLYVDEKTPLFITQNKQQRIFEIIAQNEFPYVRKKKTELVYTVCKFDNMKDAFYHAIDNFLGKPSDLPNIQKIKYPIWSTSNSYYQDLKTSAYKIEYGITDEKTLQMATNIVNNDLPGGNLVIEGYWDMNHGSFIMDNRLFIDMEHTIQQLKSMNFSVSLMIYPDMMEIAKPFREALNNQYFVKDENGRAVRYATKNFGTTYYIDMTNSAAFHWFLKRLNNLTSYYGVDSFKFYLDEDIILPQRLIRDLEQDGNLDTWLKKYVQLAFLSSNMSDVSFARGTQKYPLFVRMNIRETDWNSPLGLVSLIPTLLQMNIVGYPFVSSDIIVGNRFTDDEELFIRWLQINVFMPSIQFSYPPWVLGKTAMEQTRKCIYLHVSYFDKIKQAMENSVKYGTPVNPPIWWIDPLDPQTYQIDSEFLLGEDLLVAPVVERGARSRNIYLPKGYWKDEFSGNNKIFKGQIWLYNYPADLHELPYFSKVVSDNTAKESSSNTPARYPSKLSTEKHEIHYYKSRIQLFISMIVFAVLLVICWKLEAHKKIAELVPRRFTNIV